jgi:ABC-type enterochelin transport system permease subunit
MEHYFHLFKDWVIGLGEKHEVDPLILGSLYLVSKLCLVFFLGWVVKNLRAKKAFLTPLLCACVSFSTPYLYLIIAGRNLSVWVYIFIGLIFIYGSYTIWKTVKGKTIVVDA